MGVLLSSSVLGQASWFSAGGSGDRYQRRRWLEKQPVKSKKKLLYETS